MWIDDNIGDDTLLGPWHILLTVGDTDRSLLTVTRRELVADLRDTNRSYAHLDELVIVLGGGEHHLIDDTALAAA